MIRYIDTSVLVAALTNEAETERMKDWLTEPGPDDLAISDWVVTEFSAALSVKLRIGTIEPGHRDAAVSGLQRLIAGGFACLAVSPDDFRAAARLADQHTAGLRAGDALHLAISGEAAATLYTLDRRLAEAGLALNLAVVKL